MSNVACMWAVRCAINHRKEREKKKKLKQEHEVKNG